MAYSLKTTLLALAAVFLLCGCSSKTADSKLASEQAIALLDNLFMEEVSHSPESMTYLGLRERYDEWDDISEAATERSMAMTRRHLTTATAIDTTALDPSAKLSVKMFIEQAELTLSAHQWRHHNYPVNQMRGVHSMVPSFLINQHLIASREEAQAYIGRIKNTSLLMDQLLEQLKIREAKGIIPPQFVFPHVLKSIDNITSGAPFDQDDKDSTILADFRSKIAALEISDTAETQLIDDAQTALLKHLAPAYSKIHDYMSALQTRADNQHGVWKFPEGEAFYNFALKRTTTTDLTAEDVHQIGIAEVERIQNEMRSIMKTVNFDGDLSAFFNFTRDDKQFYYPDTAAGKQAYLDRATAVIDNMQSRLDELFITKPRAPLQVKAVEPFREASAGQAFYQSPAPDGSRPGTYFANLYRMSDMAKYQLEALAYHEGLPGHHMQISIAQELKNMPKFRLYGGHTAFIEGWGLYSELVPKEIGLYEDPYSDFGRLSGELYRACRLVVDTGIHAKRWTRQRALDYMAANVPHSHSYNVRQIERYIVMPSQATAYKIGMLKIQQLRSDATAALGEKFDIRRFHDLVLADGSVPLTILQDNVEAWVSDSLAK
ncbi:MAG: DUF885 domain-containing protein [Porticoccaceae bacterium]|nr:DUF885 domain-containing protein [Porticoccaceae bacterium]